MKTAKVGDAGSRDLLVVLEPGDELHPCVLEAAAAEHGIEGGMLSAIGAIDELELGFFCLPDNVYTRRVIHDELEVVSLTGNLALHEGKPFLHAHGVFTGRDFAAVGGPRLPREGLDHARVHDPGDEPDDAHAEPALRADEVAVGPPRTLV